MTPSVDFPVPGTPIKTIEASGSKERGRVAKGCARGTGEALPDLGTEVVLVFQCDTQHTKREDGQRQRDWNAR